MNPRSHLNLDLNLGLPDGNQDQEGTSSQVESNETAQQAQGEGIGTNANASPSFGHSGYSQTLPPFASIPIQRGHPTGQPPQHAPIGIDGVQQTGQPSLVTQNEAHQTGQPPQATSLGTPGAHQTHQPPRPAPTGQLSMVTQNENPNNSGRNHNRTVEEEESEERTMEQNPDKRQRSSYNVRFTNRGGIHNSTININSPNSPETRR